jgi:hypothetical protein
VNGQDSFWEWLGKSVKNSFWNWLTKRFKATTNKFFIRLGGWVFIPMAVHWAFIVYTDAPKSHILTVLLWAIPLLLTYLYYYWKDFVKKDC